MALDHAILGFLSRESLTGYDLKTRCFDDIAGGVWTADQAQIYRTLDRLAQRGQVRSRLVAQRGKPDRRVFEITAKGRKTLAEWQQGVAEPHPVRDPLLLRLLVSSDLSDPQLATLLGDARGEYQRRLDGARGPARDAVDAWERTTGRVREAELRRMTLAATASAARASVDWIDDCLDRIHRGLPPAYPPGPDIRETGGPTP